MTSLFQGEVNSNNKRNLPLLTGAVIAIFTSCAISLWEIQAIFRSSSSTAAIGLIFVPVIGAIGALIGFLAGWCLGYSFVNFRSKALRQRILAIAVFLVPAALTIWISVTVRNGLNLSEQVHRIEKMNADELESFLDRSPQANNKFILGAIAQNPNATASILHRIVALDRPELHEPMGSHFDVKGKNTKGLAVMRLVARNPNVAAEDLEKLAASTNEYVLSDVAMSPKLSEATLQRLGKQSGQLIDWGLARNPQTSADVLLKLAESQNQYTRGNVASNPGASVETLIALSTDPEPHVRAAVAMNPSTPRSTIEQLMKDPESWVRRSAAAANNR